MGGRPLRPQRLGRPPDKPKLPAFVAIDQGMPLSFKDLEVRDIKPTVEGVKIRAGRPPKDIWFCSARRLLGE